jgi:hypothetical protein
VSKEEFNSTPMLKKLGVTVEQIPNLIGVPDGTQLHLESKADGRLKIMASKSGDPKFSMERTFYEKDGEVVCHNDSFFLNSDSQNKGSGLKIFSEQVAACSTAGVAKIETHAAKSHTMNGYYTWPRFGYDGRLRSYTRQDASDAGLGNPEKVSDLMKTEKGRAFWKENGHDLPEAEFDLKEGSQSRKVLDAYITERESRTKPTN